MSQRELTKAEVVDLFGESPKQIERYVSEGMPCSGSGRTLRFPWPEVRNWRDDRIRRLERERLERDKPADLDLLRRRKLEAETREIEARVDEHLAKMIPIEVAAEVGGRIADRLLPVLQNAPANYGLRLEEVGVPAPVAEAVIESIAFELTTALRDAVGAAVDEDESAGNEGHEGADDSRGVA